MEQAIIPLRFYLSDGYVEWETKQGVRRSGKLSKMNEEASAALFTALSTQFAEQILKRGLEHWSRHKERSTISKLLVVTANYSHAKHFAGLLKAMGYKAKIATSHDSPVALKNIKEFRFGGLDILVTIAMAYEGLDVPQISHIICLTHIRTLPWIEQMISRAVRIDPSAGPYESQVAYVFAPDDPLFSEVVEAIRQEQVPIVGDVERAPNKAAGDSREPEREPWITPLGGEITGSREISMYGAASDAGRPSQTITVKDMEEELLARISRHIARFSFENRYKPQRINAEVKAHFRKARRNMTLRELEECLKFVQYAYPLNGREGRSATSPPRGKKRRVPTQVRLWGMD